MGFDIRVPIGTMFSLFGFLLCAYGLVTRESAIYEQHSLGVNINLWWGAVMLLFGMAMLLLFRTRMRRPNGGSTQDR
jgi:TRAP-type C4-dicarboxylate transport system permease small subunit